MSYHCLTRKVIVITHDKYREIPLKKGMHSQYCQQLISLPFVRKKLTLASERWPTSPRRTSLSYKLYIDPARRTGPATSASSNPKSIEKALLVLDAWRDICSLLYQFVSRLFYLVYVQRKNRIYMLTCIY